MPRAPLPLRPPPASVSPFWHSRNPLGRSGVRHGGGLARGPPGAARAVPPPGGLLRSPCGLWGLGAGRASAVGFSPHFCAPGCPQAVLGCRVPWHCRWEWGRPVGVRPVVPRDVGVSGVPVVLLWGFGGPQAAPPVIRPFPQTAGTPQLILGSRGGGIPPAGPTGCRGAPGESRGISGFRPPVSAPQTARRSWMAT